MFIRYQILKSGISSTYFWLMMGLCFLPLFSLSQPSPCEYETAYLSIFSSYSEERTKDLVVDFSLQLDASILESMRQNAGQWAELASKLEATQNLTLDISRCERITQKFEALGIKTSAMDLKKFDRWSFTPPVILDDGLLYLVSEVMSGPKSGGKVIFKFRKYKDFWIETNRQLLEVY